MPWICNLVYAALLIVTAPLLVYRRLVRGKYRSGWKQKLWGLLPRRSSECPCIWLHAVSVGEILQLQGVVSALQRERPDCELLITTTTPTGLAVAKERFPGLSVCYFPLDFSWAVSRALERVRPIAIVLVELELWPNFIRAASTRGIPLALINGRISPRSFGGYRWIRPLVRDLLARFTSIGVQNDEYQARFCALGAARKRVRVTGSIKFDALETNRGNLATQELARALDIAAYERVLIAGSTQAPEEAHALATYRALRGEFEGLRLILVPRHAERFEDVARLVKRAGMPLLRRSEMQSLPLDSDPAAIPPEWRHESERPVLLLDTLGELSACWGLAEIAFVGGSLTNRGGQNMMEPAAYGAAVLFGPNTQNFQEVTDALLARRAAQVVTDGADLTAKVRALLADPARARRQGTAAREFVNRRKGATRRTVELVLKMLPEIVELRPAA